MRTASSDDAAGRGPQPVAGRWVGSGSSRAEPLLLDGYRGMKERQASMVRQKPTDSLERQSAWGARAMSPAASSGAKGEQSGRGRLPWSGAVVVCRGLGSFAGPALHDR